MDLKYTKKLRYEAAKNTYLMKCTFSENNEFGYNYNTIYYRFSEEKEIPEITESILIISEILNSQGWPGVNELFQNIKENIDQWPKLKWLNDYFIEHGVRSLTNAEISRWGDGYSFTYFDDNCLEYVYTLNTEDTKECRKKIVASIIKPYQNEFYKPSRIAKGNNPEEYYNKFKELYENYFLADKINAEINKSDKSNKSKI